MIHLWRATEFDGTETLVATQEGGLPNALQLLTEAEPAALFVGLRYEGRLDGDIDRPMVHGVFGFPFASGRLVPRIETKTVRTGWDTEEVFT